VSGLPLGFIIVAFSIGGAILAYLAGILRALTVLSLRISRLGGYQQSPACRVCGQYLQAAVTPHAGQTHYCGRCNVWVAVQGASPDVEGR